jgi:mono/diheme cytochrome c family protein
MNAADYLKRSTMIAVSFVAPLALLPAVLAGEELLAEGARVFSEVAGVGCKTCHGEYAEGDLGVGPYIRGATEGTVRAAIDAIPEMIVVKSAITEEEISAISAYVSYLGSMQVARTLAKRGRFIPEEISIRPGTDVQLVIQNSGFQAYTFKSDNMGIGNVTIAARSSGSVEWHTPDSEGEYSLYCTDCKLKDQFYTVHVDSNADEFRAITPAAKIAAEDSM